MYEYIARGYIIGSCQTSTSLFKWVIVGAFGGYPLWLHGEVKKWERSTASNKRRKKNKKTKMMRISPPIEDTTKNRDFKEKTQENLVSPTVRGVAGHNPAPPRDSK